MQELFTNKTKKKFYIYNQLTFLIMFSRFGNTILLVKNRALKVY